MSTSFSCPGNNQATLRYQTHSPYRYFGELDFSAEDRYRGIKRLLRVAPARRIVNPLASHTPQLAAGYASIDGRFVPLKDRRFSAACGGVVQRGPCLHGQSFHRQAVRNRKFLPESPCRFLARRGPCPGNRTLRRIDPHCPSFGLSGEARATPVPYPGLPDEESAPATPSGLLLGR
jgi:hypothetical protein